MKINEKNEFTHSANGDYEFSSSRYPEVKERRFITDKADKKIHGMGTEQVRRIVEKYGGDISFQYSREDFETKIIVSTMQEK